MNMDKEPPINMDKETPMTRTNRGRNSGFICVHPCSSVALFLREYMATDEHG